MGKRDPASLTSKLKYVVNIDYEKNKQTRKSTAFFLKKYIQDDRNSYTTVVYLELRKKPKVRPTSFLCLIPPLLSKYSTWFMRVPV